MKGIIGKKLGMTQIFDEKGLFVPVTVVLAGPCVVAGIKTEAVDGYNAVVLGFEEVVAKKLNKAELGLFEKNKLKPMKYLKEFCFCGQPAKQIGDMVKADIFAKGDIVDATGTSKGHGFSGNIFRWNHHRLKETHGTGPTVRTVGSMGANSVPARVLPGKKMPGQYGNETQTISNLEIVKVDIDKNCILIKGSIPGARNGLVFIKSAAKASK